MENTMNNEVINETEATSESVELTPATQEEAHDMTAVETALGFGIIGGLSVLAWEFGIKPLGKKAIAGGKALLQKAKEKKSGRFEKKSNDDDVVELKDEE